MAAPWPTPAATHGGRCGRLHRTWEPRSRRWEARATELRARRDRLADELAVRDAGRRDAEHRRTRAEASLALSETRLARADTELAALSDRDRDLADGTRRHRRRDRDSDAREATAREALELVRTADAADRERLERADQASAAARDRLRTMDERLRSADRAELEARLGIDALREGVIAELAGLGELAIGHLAAAAGVAHASRAADGSTRRRDDEAICRCRTTWPSSRSRCVTAIGTIWATQPPTTAAPSPPGSVSCAAVSTSLAR